MATILEHGKYRVITCECGCKYSFELHELDANSKIKCPECSKENSATIKTNSTKSK